MIHPFRSYMYQFVCCSAFIVLLGSGCRPAVEQTTTNSQVVLKAPIAGTNLQRQGLTLSPGTQACESRGFIVVARFDTTTERTIEYCQFTDGSECRLDEFSSGICGPGQGAAVLTNLNLIANPFVEFSCSETSPPVCGTNGHTYTNACIAAQSGVSIAREGRCSAEEIAASIPTAETTNTDTRTQTISTANTYISGNSNTPSLSSSNEGTEAKDQQYNQAWLASVIALIEGRGPTTPRTYIDICRQGNNTVYLQTNGTNNLPSTLYTARGEILCNPNRDFAGRCPGTGAPTGCSRVYTDTST